jgi:hypothetical protein
VHARMGSARKHLIATALAGSALLCLIATSIVPAGAVQVSHDVIVSANPADFTPNITDPEHQNWHVESIAKVGNRIIVAGKFTQVQNSSGGPIFPVDGLFAFDATTGLIDDTGFGFPIVAGRLDALAAAGDGTSVFLGGGFNKVNGVTARNIVKLDIATGQVITAFKGSANDKVNDLVVRAGTLYLGGTFTSLRGLERLGIGAFDAVTGQVNPDLVVPVTGTRLDGIPVHVDAIDVTPDASRMLVAGNFNVIGGLDRKQIGQIDLTTSPDTVADWQTDRYGPNCAFPKFETYIRDVDYSPDGSYFGVATTGATAVNHGGSHLSGPLCDSNARFETYATGTGINATWANFTGGDTNYSIAITDEAVYVGGHQRWQNNYYGKDKPEEGSVSRQGIAAFSPLNGIPFSWNPARTRGLGAQALLATDDGLWVGSDTDLIGDEFHQKIALMPVVGGSPDLDVAPGTLPGDLFTVEQDGDLIRRSYDPLTDTFGPGAEPTVNDWSKVRGAYMLGGTLYTGWDDDPLVNGDNGTLRRQPVNLATGVVGTQKVNDLRGLDIDIVGNRIHQPPHMGIQLEDMSGAFWDASSGRLYYTVLGDAKLYYRYFLPESNLLGDFRFTACTWNVVPASSTCGAFNPSTARGMTMAGGELYFGAGTGELSVMGFDSATGQPAGTPSVISGPAIDGNDWNSRALFVRSD